MLDYLNTLFNKGGKNQHYNFGGVFYLIGSIYFYMYYMRSKGYKFKQTILYLMILIIITISIILFIDI